MGADDYVTKTLNTAELNARVQAQLRRYFDWNEGKPQKCEDKISVEKLDCNGLDEAFRRLMRNIDCYLTEYCNKAF